MSGYNQVVSEIVASFAAHKLLVPPVAASEEMQIMHIDHKEWHGQQYYLQTRHALHLQHSNKQHDSGHSSKHTTNFCPTKTHMTR